MVDPDEKPHPAIRVELLGPVRAWCDDRPVALGPVRQQGVFAVLALRAGSPVSAADLLRAGWGDDPPSIGEKIIPSYVYRLRKAFARAGAPTVLGHEPAGYRLEISPAAVDVHAFQEAAEQATQSARAGAVDSAVETLERALRGWRGDPLAGLPGPYVARQRVRLLELLLDASEDRFDLDLRRGRREEAIAGLGVLLIDHPLRERAAELLMGALKAADRRVDALEVYARIRRALVEELGVEPGDRLRRAHRDVLGDAAPAASGDCETGGSEIFKSRCDLPSQPAGFIGRVEELSTLAGVPPEPPGRSGVPVYTIDGMAGVGKTALALSAAHALADRYVDGRLFLDLRGHTAGAEPLSAGEALGRLLGAIGTHADGIPADADERASRWRARLSGRRLLVVLDNASTAAQVRQLLPGDAGCLVVVTSRRRLLGLEPTRHVHLCVPPTGEALDLLCRSAGPGRIDRGADGTFLETAAARRVVELCGRLPLAVRIAGTKLRHRPDWSVADLAARLADPTTRFETLAAEDRRVDTAFQLSYLRLGPGGRRTLRLLGRGNRGEIGAPELARLAGTDRATASAALEGLLDANLLRQSGPGRYRLPPLLHAYAARLGHPDDGDQPGDRPLAAVTCHRFGAPSVEAGA